MSLSAAITAVRDALADWTATPLGFDNEDFIPPEPPSLWGFVEVKSTTTTGTFHNSPGNRLVIDDGMVWGHFFAPVGSGYAEIVAIAESFGALFAAKLLGGVQFLEPNLDSHAHGDAKGAWFRFSVSIPFMAASTA